MAELQLLPALLAMYKSIGDILEAGQQEGGTIDVFEIHSDFRLLCDFTLYEISYVNFTLFKSMRKSDYYQTF